MTIYKELVNEGEDLSYRQTLNVINENFTSVYAPYKIQIHSRNKAKRVLWVKEHLEWRDTRWNDVVFTDEKLFMLVPQGKHLRVKIMEGEEKEDFSIPKVQQGGDKVTFWALSRKKGRFI